MAHPPPRAPRRRSATPLLVMGAVAVAIVLALLLAVAFRVRARGEEGPPLDVLGSALPEGWLPGGGRGAGQAPPPPPRDPTPPRGSAPAAPAPEVPPYVARPRPEPLYPEPTPPGLPPPPEAAPPVEPPPEEEEERLVVFEPPRLIAMPRPTYPRVGRRMRMQATVVVRVRVGTSGRVLEAEAVGDPVGYGFEEAAVRAARQARFEPARRNGERVVADSHIAVRFEL